MSQIFHTTQEHKDEQIMLKQTEKSCDYELNDQKNGSPEKTSADTHKGTQVVPLPSINH